MPSTNPIFISICDYITLHQYQYTTHKYDPSILILCPTNLLQMMKQFAVIKCIYIEGSKNLSNYTVVIIYQSVVLRFMSLLSNRGHSLQKNNQIVHFTPEHHNQGFHIHYSENHLLLKESIKIA